MLSQASVSLLQAWQAADKLPMEMRTRGLILLDMPGLLRLLDDDSVELVDFASGQLATADGELARGLRQYVGSGEMPSALAALAELNPLVGRMVRAERRAPLTAAEAVRMGGFGTLFVELVGRCNERCVHCYAESSPEVSAALARTTCHAIIDDAAALGFRRVQLTGGDPLLCPFVVELVERIAARALRCEIYTNGLLLKRELLAALLPLRPSFAFSFYSHDAATHDAITRTPDSQRRTLRAIELALAAGLDVRVSVVVMEQNAAQLDATLELLRNTGVRDVGVSGSHAVGRGSYFRAPLSAVPRASHRGAPREREEGGRGTLCVTYRGEVTPCIFNRVDVLGRLPAQRLCDVARAPRLRLEARRGGASLLDSCRTSLQCRGCQATAYALRTGA